MAKKQHIIDRKHNGDTLSKHQFANEYYNVDYRTLKKWMYKNTQFMIAYRKAGFIINDATRLLTPKQQELILYYIG